MEEKFYLFVFTDGNSYEMKCGISVKDAMWEMAKYRGVSSTLMLKCLKGFESNDTDDLVALYNHFAITPIERIYIVEHRIYPSED